MLAAEALAVRSEFSAAENSSLLKQIWYFVEVPVLSRSWSYFFLQEGETGFGKQMQSQSVVY